MPYIEAKLSIKLDDIKKDKLQNELTNIVSGAFSKPKAYIMTNIEDSKFLYMSGRKVESGAYITIQALGSISKQSCDEATKEICNMLVNDFNLVGPNIYITYHPVDLWGFNGSMF